MDTKTHILIVDDDPDLRNSLKDILKAKGFSVRTAATGKTALKRIQEKSPDVALVDLKLVDMPGLEVLKELKALSPFTEAIMITGYASRESAIEAVNLDAYNYVQKPYKIDQLLLTIRRAAEKKKTEEALRKSEEGYRSIFENAIEGIYQTTPDGRFLTANPALAEMFRYDSPEELIASTTDIEHQFFVHPQQREEFKRLVEQGKVHDFEWQAYRKDGSIAWLSENAHSVKDENGKVIHYEGTVKDITERVHADQQIRLSSEIISNLSDGVYLIRAKDGVIVYTNPRFEEMFGYHHDEMIGKHVSIVNAPTHKPPEETTREIIRVLKRDKVWRGEIQNIKKDGTPFWCYARVTTFNHSEYGEAWISIHQDITERKQAKIERSTIFELPAILLMVAKPDATIVDISAGWKDIMGYSRDEMVGKSFLDFIHPDDLPSSQSGTEVVAAGEVMQYFENRYRHKDGSYRTLAWSATADPELGLNYGIAQDITKRQQAEDQARKQSAILNAINRVFREALTSETETAVAATCLAVAEEITNSKFGLIGELNPTGLFDTIAISNPGWEACKMPDSEATRLIRNMEIRGVDRAMLREGKSRIVNEPASHPDSVGTPEGHPPITSFLGVPLKQAGKTIGMIGLGNKESGYSQDDQEAIEVLSVAFVEAIRRKRAEKNIQNQIKNISALREIDMAITASLDLRVTMNVILDQTTSRLGVDAAVILLFNPHTHDLEYIASRGLYFNKRVGTVRIGYGESFAGRVVMNRELLYVPNLNESEMGSVFSELITQEKFVSYIGLPLIAKGHVKGILEIFQRSPLNPDKGWFTFLEALGGQSAIAIDNASLFDDLQRSNLELRLAYDTTLEGWVRALAFKDEETEEHSQRVTNTTVKLTKLMGIDDEKLVHIRRGALLHDIGKMAISESILLKPGKLTDKERKIIEKHPVHAFEWLSPIEYLRPALDIPYCHHEKWDGTGYPRGLKGKQIPLSASIFSVVDVWDALSSDRPYRKAWPSEKVLPYIKEQSGKSFDPRIVEEFINLIYKADE